MKFYYRPSHSFWFMVQKCVCSIKVFSVGDVTLRLMWYVILSSSISEDARKMLTSFGSAYISALAFRDVWAFVGRPNLKGYTLYEDVRMPFRFFGISVFFAKIVYCCPG